MTDPTSRRDDGGPEARKVPASSFGRWVTAAILLLLLLLAGCYRVEYHRRPGFITDAQAAELPDKVTLSDGTVIVYEDRRNAGGLKPRDTEGKPALRIREERDDGTVILRAAVPEDVLSNTLTCLRNQEYELLWDQMVAERTKLAYEAQGQGVEAFTAFMRRNRMDLAATLTRMLLGLSRQQAYLENAGPGVIRVRFHPQVATEFRFKTVDIVSEQQGLRLLVIR